MSITNEHWKRVLRSIHDLKCPGREDYEKCIKDICDQSVDTSLVIALLVSLRLTKLERDPMIISVAAQLFRSKALQFQLENFKASNGGSIPIADIVGTGGDGHDTFNVSTSAAIVAAGAGLVVIKHGNSASSSSSGSANLLDSLDCQIDQITADNVHDCMNASKFCFLFAQNFHPTLKYLASARKMIGLPGLFNILGPLISPAPVTTRVIGVSALELGQPVAEALLTLDPNQKSLVVCGNEGLDEISIAGPTSVWHIENGKIKVYSVSPSQFGLQCHPLDEVKSGKPMENAEILMQLLENKLPDNHPILDFVLINAAALLYISGKASDLVEGVQAAVKSIKSGAALHELQKYRDFTQRTRDII